MKAHCVAGRLQEKKKIFENATTTTTKRSKKMQLMYKIVIDFVPGRPGTEEFVPGHLLLPLSRDKGTPGQEIFFVPGQRDNGTSRPGLRPVPWKP